MITEHASMPPKPVMADILTRWEAAHGPLRPLPVGLPATTRVD
jgi:hypothetical protein